MNGCEGFEIAVEMRLHGAADRDASERLDAHLATCEACRQFELEVRAAEKTMRERGGTLEGAFDGARLREKPAISRPGNAKPHSTRYSRAFAAESCRFVFISREAPVTWRTRPRKSSSSSFAGSSAGASLGRPPHRPRPLLSRRALPPRDRRNAGHPGGHGLVTASPGSEEAHGRAQGARLRHGALTRRSISRATGGLSVP